MAIDNYHQLVANPEGAKELGVTLRTKREWEKNDPDFPPTYWINGRKYNKRGELREYIERRRVSSETKKNPGWEVARSRARVKGRFSTTDNGDEEADSV
jgi:hypothetical protein